MENQLHLFRQHEYIGARCDFDCGRNCNEHAAKSNERVNYICQSDQFAGDEDHWMGHHHIADWYFLSGAVANDEDAECSGFVWQTGTVLNHDSTWIVHTWFLGTANRVFCAYKKESVHIFGWHD